MELRIAIVEDQKFEAQQMKTQENFLVCNRGLLLNMDKVLRFEGDCIEMLDGALTALCLGCAALCTIFELPSNVFLLPILIVSFRLLRWGSPVRLLLPAEPWMRRAFSDPPLRVPEELSALNTFPSIVCSCGRNWRPSPSIPVRVPAP